MEVSYKLLQTKLLKIIPIIERKLSFSPNTKTASKIPNTGSKARNTPLLLASLLSSPLFQNHPAPILHPTTKYKRAIIPFNE